MSTTEKYISEAQMKDKPKKPIGLFLKDKSVTTRKIADNSITWDKLDSDVYERIINGDSSIILLSYIGDMSLDDLKDNNYFSVGDYVCIKENGNSELYFKEGEAKSTDGKVYGIFKLEQLSKQILYIDSSTGDIYIWNGMNLVLNMEPLSNGEIDEIASENIQMKTAHRMAPMSQKSQVVAQENVTSINIIDLTNK